MALFKDATPTARRILVGNRFSDLGSGLTPPFLVIYIGEVRGLGIAFAGVVRAYPAVVALAATGPLCAGLLLGLNLTLLWVGLVVCGCLVAGLLLLRLRQLLTPEQDGMITV